MRRVRCVNGVTNHKQVAQNDLRQAARLTALCDKKVNFFATHSRAFLIKGIGIAFLMKVEIKC